MKPFLTVLIACFFITMISAQDKESFPERFLGSYKGDLEIYNSKGKQTIPMEFHLFKKDSLDTYEYRLVYNGQPRNYTLILKNKKQGLYEIDEHNGIVLPARAINNNSLYSFFEVEGNLLTTRLSFANDSLDFEILFTAVKNKTTTGKGTKEIPFVYGYPISVVQRAILVKQ